MPTLFKYKMTQKALFFITTSFLYLLLAGCQVQGISGPGKTTTLGYDLNRLQKVEAQPQASLPLHLIVAQAGSLSPDPSLLSELKKHPKLFRKITVLPASPELRNLGHEVTQKDPNLLVQQAANLGGDLLYLVGGKIEANSSRTPVSVLDLSGIGRYLIPSNKIQGEASVFGAVISIPHRELIMTVHESISKSKYSPTVSRYANTDEFVQKLRNELLAKLSKKFVTQFADHCGTTLQPSSKPIDVYGISNKGSKATIYIMSDGLHIGLILPYTNFFGEQQHIEIGLGERNWVLGKGWKWMDTIMSFSTASEGVAVIEYVHRKALQTKFNQNKKVWKAELSEEQFGKMLMTLEEELSFQKVLFQGYKTKVIETDKGYNLFHTCHQFALNPLGVTGTGLFDSIPRPTPILEKRLDRFFERKK